jgi:peptidoglycan/xylan/chitin deacetylase (PgdA/CDA1 family)
MARNGKQQNGSLKSKRPRHRAPWWRRLLILAVIPVAVAAVLCAAAAALLLTPAHPGEPPRAVAWLETLAPPGFPVIPTKEEASLTPSVTPSVTSTETPSPTLPPWVTPTVTPTPTPPLTPDGEVREARVPILMYHYVSVPPPGSDEYRVDLSVTPESFREQMTWLADNGYEVVSLQELVYALETGSPDLPDNPVVLTFDDGYVDNYENAFPILQEFGYPATFFILTDVTDRRQGGYMTWEMLREMHEAGMDIEVHGREHVEMTDREPDWLYYHLVGPTETIEANLGYQPHYLSYPAGKYDADVIAAAIEHGYYAAVTTVQGGLQTSESPYELRRLRVRGGWPLGSFASVVQDFASVE